MVEQEDDNCNRFQWLNEQMKKATHSGHATESATQNSKSNAIS